jgi:predicted protein tyrosine phosphatase
MSGGTKKAILYLTIALAAVALPALAGYLAQDLYLNKNWGQVEPGLYRSGLSYPVLTEKFLRKHHVDLIVSLLYREDSDPSQVAEVRAARDLGIPFLRFPLAGDGMPAGGEERIDIHVAAVEAIWRAREEGKTVLVHCAAGAYRTGAVVALYQLLVRGLPPDQVYSQMLRYNYKLVNKNLPDGALIKFLNRHMAEAAQMLQQRGVIDQIPAQIPRLGPEAMPAQAATGQAAD